jgi:FkbM family methyltransferase
LTARVYRRALTPRWAELIGQMRLGEVSESDIRLFGLLDGLNGLVVDAGANRGQFALSLFAVNRSLNVLSFEANPSLRWALLAIRTRHPRRFRFRLEGLGDRPHRGVLHVPRTQGFDLSSNASLDPREFDRGLVRRRLSDYASGAGGRYGFRSRPVRLVRLDDLGVDPIAVKIDVEGWELQALQGMQRTLKRCFPLLMIELNQPERFMPWLEDFGYRFYGFDAASGSLTTHKLIEGRLNIFALHPRSPHPVIERLAPHIRAGA